MIAEANLIQFNADNDVRDLCVIPKHILSKLTLQQLEDLKQRWWRLFSASAECRGTTYLGAFNTIMDALGKEDAGDSDVKWVNFKNLTLMLDIDKPEQYRITWKKRHVVLSYIGKKFVPGMKWMDEFDSLYGEALNKIQQNLDAQEERNRQSLLEELIVE